MTWEAQTSQFKREIIGLIPAGGQAKRLAPLPCSKELYPVGFRAVNGERTTRPKVVCHYLLEKMQRTGIQKTYIILRPEKWDIPSYFGDGSMIGMHLAYLMVHLPYGTPYTLDQAYPFAKQALVVMGFPDILFQPEDAFVHLIARQAQTKADVVLGLFPTQTPQKFDMVDTGEDGRVHQIVIKPSQTDLRYTWVIATWTPRFTQFMHDYLAVTLATNNESDYVGDAPGNWELYVGDVIQAAVSQGMPVQTVCFPDGECLDIGTAEDLMQAVRILSDQSWLKSSDADLL